MIRGRRRHPTARAGRPAPVRLCAAVGTLLWLGAVARGGGARVGGCTVTLSPRDDVQRAIDGLAVATRPARVCLDAGEFVLRRFLSIRRDGVTVRGQGPATVLRLAEGVESPVVVIGDYESTTPRRPTAHVTIERLRVVGGGPAGSEMHPAYGYLTNSAIVVRAGRDVTIRDLEVMACRSACVLTERDTRDVSIERNQVGDSVWDGISLNRTARAHVADNVIRGNTAAGITNDHLEDSIVERNVIEGNRTHGVYLADSYRNRFADNRFVANVLSGVFLTCAVRHRDANVTCWPDSMSAANLFTRDEFVGNRVGFTVAPADGADCTGHRFAVNRSQGDRFSRNPRDEPYPAGHGRCLVFSAGTARPSARSRR